MRKILLFLIGFMITGSQLLAQNQTVTGTVQDEKGMPIPNV